MRFRFTIRDLLWLTALIAMAVAWWLDHRRVEKINAEIQPADVDLKQRMDLIQSGIHMLNREGHEDGIITFRLKK